MQDRQGQHAGGEPSGGQQQRLSIACALIHDPEIVFFDEPSAALDPQARRNLWDVLRSINDHRKTVLPTTHHMDEAETLCDRVAIVDNGKILHLGAPAELVRTLDAPVRISVEAGSLTVELAGTIEGVDEVTGDKVIAGTLSFLAIGLLVGSVAKTSEGGSGLANLITLPMTFLSGALIPLEAAPQWLVTVSKFLRWAIWWRA